MPSLLCRIKLSAPVVRAAAVVALVGAPYFISPLTEARAGGVDRTQTQLQQGSFRLAGAESAHSNSESIEQRISDLHKTLKITRDQETMWSAVTQVMRDNVNVMQKMVAERKALAPQNITAIDDLRSYESFTKAHADGLKKLIVVFEVLYNSMPNTQQKIADQVFQKFGLKGARLHG